MITGHYTLLLICDQKKPDACPEKRVFVNDTRMEALATAREVGWLISKSKTAYCPVHADERRASWR